MRSPQICQDSRAKKRPRRSCKKSSARPGSAPVKGRTPPNTGADSGRSRSNTTSNTNNRRSSSTLPTPGKASTTIQKHWKGHQTRNKDEKVTELKSEVRQLRTDEHVKHLTKELNTAKAALELMLETSRILIDGAEGGDSHGV